KKIEKMNGAQYLSNLIPNYLFEHRELSSLLEKLQAVDPCSSRHAQTDDMLLKLINAEDPLIVFSQHIKEEYLTAVKPKILKSTISRTELAKFFIRLNYFSNYSTSDYLSDTDFDEYVTWLFEYNNHDR